VSKRSITKIDLVGVRRQSLFRSPSSRHAIPKFPPVGKQLNIPIRTSVSAVEQGFLSPPMSPQLSSHRQKNKKIRGPLGAITPDLYFTGSACSSTDNPDKSIGNSTIFSQSSTGGERFNDDMLHVDDKLAKLHVRMQYDDHRNDLIVNIIEGNTRTNTCEKEIDIDVF
jgi:hypothetical protein